MRSNAVKVSRIVGLCAGLLFVACDTSIDFDIPKTFVIQGSTTVNKVVTVDLGSQLPDAQKVKALLLGSADLTITAVDPSNQATVLNGTLSLRPAGAPDDGSKDIALGAVTNASVAAGSSARLSLPGGDVGNQVSDAVLGSFRNHQPFSVLLVGTADASPNFTVQLTIHASAHIQLF